MDFLCFFFSFLSISTLEEHPLLFQYLCVSTQTALTISYFVSPYNINYIGACHRFVIVRYRAFVIFFSLNSFLYCGVCFFRAFGSSNKAFVYQCLARILILFSVPSIYCIFLFRDDLKPCKLVKINIYIFRFQLSIVEN